MRNLCARLVMYPSDHEIPRFARNDTAFVAAEGPQGEGSRGTSVITKPRNSHDPMRGLIKHVFLPMKPRPAVKAQSRSSTGPVST